MGTPWGPRDVRGAGWVSGNFLGPGAARVNRSGDGRLTPSHSVIGMPRVEDSEHRSQPPRLEPAPPPDGEAGEGQRPEGGDPAEQHVGLPGSGQAQVLLEEGAGE